MWREGEKCDEGGQVLNIRGAMRWFWSHMEELFAHNDHVYIFVNPPLTGVVSTKGIGWERHGADFPSRSWRNAWSSPGCSRASPTACDSGHHWLGFAFHRPADYQWFRFAPEGTPIWKAIYITLNIEFPLEHALQREPLAEMMHTLTRYMTDRKYSGSGNCVFLLHSWLIFLFFNHLKVWFGSNQPQALSGVTQLRCRIWHGGPLGIRWSWGPGKLHCIWAFLQKIWDVVFICFFCKWLRRQKLPWNYHGPLYLQPVLPTNILLDNVWYEWSHVCYKAFQLCHKLLQ